MESKISTPRYGSETAEEIYVSVGLALSWWEASEDVLMGLVRTLLCFKEPTAFETYVDSPRSTRTKMLTKALSRYDSIFIDDEIKITLRAMKELDKLASLRNQIAHGYVGNVSRTANDVLIMQGHFLIPSLNEVGQNIARDFRYAHTAAEIDQWRDKVREQRGKILDIDMNLQQRRQQAPYVSSNS